MIFADKSPLARLGAALLIVLIFAILFRNLQTNYESLSRLAFTFHYRPLVFSFLVLLFTLLFNPWAWQKIMGGMNEPMTYRQSFTIIYISQLGKYLPGRIWSYISQVYLAKKEGLSGEKTLVASLLFQMISSLLSLYVFAFSFLFWEEMPLVYRIALFAFSSLASYLFLNRDITGKALAFILNRVLKRNTAIALESENFFVALILILSWLAYGSAYYFFLNAFYPVDIQQAAIFTGVYAVSWLIGYASLITPGGLGIREGVQAYLLHLFLPLPISIIISLAGRIWLTAGEIVVSLIALSLLKRKKR